MNRRERRKIDAYIRRRDLDAINAINRDGGELYESACRVLKDLLLILVGAGMGMYISTFRANAYTASQAASIPPRCEYVGAIPKEAVQASQPPTGVNETAVATMPDAVMVEAVGERWERLGTWKTTGYCPCRTCNGRNAGKTASGAPMTPGRTVAVGGIPFGTVLKIGGTEYVVEDRGTPYGHIDILYSDHRTAHNHGVQYAEVFIKKGE